MSAERGRAIPDRGLPRIERAESTPDRGLPGLDPNPLAANRNRLGFDLNEPGRDLNMQGFAPSALRSKWKLPGSWPDHFIPNLSGFRFTPNAFFPYLSLFIFELSKFVSNLNSLRFNPNSPSPAPDFFGATTIFFHRALALPQNLGYYSRPSPPAQVAELVDALVSGTSG